MNRVISKRRKKKETKREQSHILPEEGGKRNTSLKSGEGKHSAVRIQSLKEWALENQGRGGSILIAEWGVQTRTLSHLKKKAGLAPFSRKKEEGSLSSVRRTPQWKGEGKSNSRILSCKQEGNGGVPPLISLQFRGKEACRHRPRAVGLHRRKKGNKGGGRRESMRRGRQTNRSGGRRKGGPKLYLR